VIDPSSITNAAVRKRPGMFVGDLDTGDGVLMMVLELVANACDQHFAARCSRIDIDVAADGMIAVEDDGPGMQVHGGDGLPPLDILLTRRSERPTADGHRPHVHLGLGGIGLVVVNALSERFELATVRDGIEARTTYARGEMIEPLTAVPTLRPSGTRIRFRPDPLIFLHTRVPRTRLAARLEDLSFLLPQLTMRWRIAGDEVAAGGLAARVALGVPCAQAEVAHHRGSFDTASGPIDVEVALAWRSMKWDANSAPVFGSFVNLERTRSNGTHVDGLVDGVAAFLGRGGRSRHAAGMVAAVAVILADVKWGNPTKDRLDSPEARAPVAEATRLALARWAEAHPEAAAALRDHKRRR
jgi:DNA gyrase subunit B